jgi:hypothetical protein
VSIKDALKNAAPVRLEPVPRAMRHEVLVLRDQLVASDRERREIVEGARREPARRRARARSG